MHFFKRLIYILVIYFGNRTIYVQNYWIIYISLSLYLSISLSLYRSISRSIDLSYHELLWTWAIYDQNKKKNIIIMIIFIIINLF